MSRPTMDEMRQVIMDMMLHREWNPGASHKELAERWGVAPRTVADRALEASRVIRTAARVEVKDFVSEALVELDSLAAEARKLGKPRDAAYCIELKAKMLGAMAPTKTQEVPPDKPRTKEDLWKRIKQLEAEEAEKGDKVH